MCSCRIFSPLIKILLGIILVFGNSFLLDLTYSGEICDIYNIMYTVLSVERPLKRWKKNKTRIPKIAVQKASSFLTG